MVVSKEVKDREGLSETIFHWFSWMQEQMKSHTIGAKYWGKELEGTVKVLHSIKKYETLSLNFFHWGSYRNNMFMDKCYALIEG